MKVFITRKIPEIGINLLKSKGLEVEIFDKNKINEDQLIKKAKDADAILSLITDKISRKVIYNLHSLTVISNYGVGYNNINVKAATERKICVTNTPGVLTDATADLTMALILSVSRRIIEADKFMRQGKFKGWDPMLFLGIDLKDKVLGILGAGRIGRAVGKRAYAFCMKIYYSDKNSNCYLESELNAKKISLRELLKKSDILSVHVPLTQETFHLLGRKELSLMKSSSIIINTARGEVIDEKVLIDFLQKNKIAAAGFDVYEGEPKVNKELLKLKNVVVLPHIGSATIETRNKMIEIAAQNIIDRLFGKKPKYLVNPEVYES